MSKQQKKTNKLNTVEDSNILSMKNINSDNAWKAVGTPSRRGSTVEKNVKSEIVEDESLGTRKKSISSDVNWGSFNGFQWEGPSIFEEEGKANTIPSIAPNTIPENGMLSNVLSVPMLPGVSLEPIYRQQRSLSFSMGQDPTLFGYDDYEYQHAQFRHPLVPMVEEEEEEQEMNSSVLAFIRSRSKSSSAAFGLLSQSRLYNRRESEHFDRSTWLLNEISLGDQEHLRLSQERPHGTRLSHIQQLTDQLESTHLHSVATREKKGFEKGLDLHSLEGPFLRVEFKAGRAECFYSPQVHPRLGDLVVVEGDRGKDLGKVVENTLTARQVSLLEQKRLDSAEHGILLKRILKLASTDDIKIFLMKQADEKKALAVCQQKVRQRKLPMHVVDAEYQWDRRKLTFYFEAEHRIDFRELVRELFKTYKTRIWMCIATTPVTLKGAESEDE